MLPRTAVAGFATAAVGDIRPGAHERVGRQLLDEGRKVCPRRRKAVGVAGVIAGGALGKATAAGAVVVPPVGGSGVEGNGVEERDSG